MQEVRLALVGFGNVAQGLAQILDQNGEQYAQKYGLRFLITAIADPIKGTAFDQRGIDPARLLTVGRQPGGLDSLPCEHPGWEALEMIQNSPADVVVELSYTNLQTGEPATTYVAEALQRKKHVVTTNKGPIALHYNQLAELAHLHHREIGIEGTVMSGTPCLRMGRELLAPAGILKIQGILNGTTNFILTQMESGKPYADALAEAQAQGYAEADPTGDVEGYDAAAKVAILARQVMGVNLPLSEVRREGITGLTEEDVQQARADNQSWKLIGTLENENGQLRASVCPERLPAGHPLAQVSGATNAVLFSTRMLGDVTLIGPGAGRLETGYAVVEDLLAIYRLG